MHEVAAMRGVVSQALDAMRAVGAIRVVGVHLLLGASGHLSEEAARQHFATMAKGTPAEDAELTFTWLPATYQCFACLRRFETTAPAESIACPECGGVALEIRHTDTCAVIDIDVSDDLSDDLSDEETPPAVGAASGIPPGRPGVQVAASTPASSSPPER